MQTPELNTQRLKLRYVQTFDLAAIHKLLSHPETDRFNTLGIPDSQEQTAAYITNWISGPLHPDTPDFTFAVMQKTDAELVGLIGLKMGRKKLRRAEVWFKFHPDFWGRGFATESLKALLDFGFTQHNLHRIEAGCATENLASVRVLEKAGMTREGRKRLALPLSSGWSDTFEYAILKSDPGA